MSLKRATDSLNAAIGFVCGLITVAILAVALHAQSPAQVLWFTASNGYNASGGVTCKVYKVVQTPIRVSYNCSDIYGVRSGSYTADARNGGNGVNWFTVDLHGSVVMDATGVNLAGSDLRCVVNLNATASPVQMVDGLVSPNSASYSCGGMVTVGKVGAVTWP